MITEPGVDREIEHQGWKFQRLHGGYIKVVPGPTSDSKNVINAFDWARIVSDLSLCPGIHMKNIMTAIHVGQ